MALNTKLIGELTLASTLLLSGCDSDDVRLSGSTSTAEFEVIKPGAVDTVAISSDGLTYVESDPDDSTQVTVYTRTTINGEWAKDTDLSGDNIDSYDGFGMSISLNDDGTVLLVGAYAEDSTSTSVNSTEDDAGDDNGAASMCSPIQLGIGPTRVI